MLSAIVVNPADNVATALIDLPAGHLLELAGGSVTVAEAIPAGHKVALRPIAQGEPVIKYGDPVARATRDIGVGSKVHVHNCTDILPELRREA